MRRLTRNNAAAPCMPLPATYALTASLPRLQFNQQLSEHCRKKAALCLRRVFLKLPPEASVIAPDEWSARFSSLLLAPFTAGAQLAVMGLLNAVLERSTEGYEALQPLIVRNLVATASGRGMRRDYLYYGIPSPWLQCKCAAACRLNR
jgi:AP-2 complex subunit alpha